MHVSDISSINPGDAVLYALLSCGLLVLSMAIVFLVVAAVVKSGKKRAPEKRKAEN